MNMLLLDKRQNNAMRKSSKDMGSKSTAAPCCDKTAFYIGVSALRPASSTDVVVNK